MSRSAINVPSRYMIANIASDDGLILPHRANPAGSNFRERQPFFDICFMIHLRDWLSPRATSSATRRGLSSDGRRPLTYAISAGGEAIAFSLLAGLAVSAF